MSKLEAIYTDLLKEIGEDHTREGLERTPHRAANAIKELTKGYHEDIEKIVNKAIFKSDMDEMVIVKSIDFFSLCEHHLLPFFGKCHVAYIPKGKVIGLSKIPRIVEVFARRLQIQENLTMQIANTILDHTGADGVGVVVEAQHLCMMMRGVQKQNSVMTTSCMLGSFRTEISTRAEFLSLIGKKS